MPSRVTWSDILVSGESRRATSAFSPSVDLEAAVRRLDFAVGSVTSRGTRRAPSAGSCYPYEIYVYAQSDPSRYARLDFAKRTVVASSERLVAADDLAYALVGRPWLSMRKYGRRGYLYYLLDVGHAVLNISLTLNGDEPARPAVTRQPTRDLGNVVAYGRIARSERSDSWGASGRDWTYVTDARRALVVPNELERHCASAYPGNLDMFDTAMIDVHDFVALREFIPARVSAGSFSPTTEREKLDDALLGLRNATKSVVDSIALRWPTATVLLAEEESLGSSVTRDEVVAALAGQTHLNDAAAYVTFSISGIARDGDLTGDDQRSLICAGILGEIAYLIATRYGIGITAIGNFDAEWWATRISGEADRYVAYMLALGVAQKFIKVDRVSPSGAHSSI